MTKFVKFPAPEVKFASLKVELTDKRREARSPQIEICSPQGRSLTKTAKFATPTVKFIDKKREVRNAQNFTFLPVNFTLGAANFKIFVSELHLGGCDLQDFCQ